MQQHFADLHRRCTVVDGPAHMALQFSAAAQGGQHRAGAQAARLEVDAVPLPRAAPGVLVEPILQRRRERIQPAHRAFHERVAHHLRAACAIISAVPSSTAQKANRRRRAENRYANATPHDTLAIPPAASGMPVPQSTWPACAYVASAMSEPGTTSASAMPWARVCGIPKNVTSAGTTTSPPPTVKMPDIAPLATPINGRAAAGIARGAACVASPAFGFSLSCEAKYTASAIRNTANAVCSRWASSPAAKRAAT
ncbi:hypothetical protein COLO4_00971 [Corchorus olitorius]|uniref:Uncharacterized protein n=1 Tax=Corchorus olitorius TaxID=93759 RepID=A0A1R3L3C1_9ROSI|nr:hypothetical protein COLO4_00971 [Corchorus olitorius]